MIKGYQRLTYEERLKRCGLTTLEKRRVRGDLIEAYKILTNKVEVPRERYFATKQYDGTRGHNMKLFKKRVGRHKQNSFSARVVDRWNELDEKIVMATSVDNFKVKLGTIGY